MARGPRVGTRVEGAEEGGCEGEEDLRDLTGLFVTLIGHNLRADSDAGRETLIEDLSGLIWNMGRFSKKGVVHIWGYPGYGSL